MTGAERKDLAPRLWGGDDAPALAWLRGTPQERRAWWRYWGPGSLLGLADMALHHGMRLGTVESCSWVGAQLGRLTAPRNHPDWHARADDAVRRLRPELTETERADLLARRWANIGRTMTEFSILDRLSTPKHLSVIGQDHIEAARAQGRPVIIAVTHLGNWELSGGALRSLNIPFMAVYQPPRNRFRHYLAVRARARAGYPLLPPGRAGAMPAVRALRAGTSLFLGIDEYVDGRVHGPFFGRAPETRGNMARAVRFARMTGAALLPTWIERHPGARFTAHFEPPVPVDDLTDTPEDLLTGVGRLNAVVEPIVRDHLDQWFMLHELRFDC